MTFRCEYSVHSRIEVILGIGLPMEVDVSIIMGYVLKFNYVLPYNVSYLTNPYVRYDRSIKLDIEQDEGGASLKHEKGAFVASRWDIYELLESVLESTGSGKGCLLRAICEVAAAPFAGGQGLTSEILRLILT
ncbi:hypothetical protein KM043_017037 [Ampulex compressa]|nr:hypothetical protein KM043_017037 [Ampulex compressa]